MTSLWNRMLGSSTADSDQNGINASEDNNLTNRRGLSAPLNSPSKKQEENNVNKRNSAPEPTCEEKVHYPIYDALNPRHNPVARSRSMIWPSRHPTTPKSKATNPSKSAGWVEISPVRSLRKVRSGFLAFAEELRSKPSSSREVSPKPTSLPTDPLSSTDNPSQPAPTLKLDLFDQMSLSPFIITPSVSSADTTAPSLPPNSSLSRPVLTTTMPKLSCTTPSFLSLPEMNSPLEDQFRSEPAQAPKQETIAQVGRVLNQMPLPDAILNDDPGRTATAEESFHLETEGCNISDRKDSSSNEGENNGSPDSCSPVMQLTAGSEDAESSNLHNHAKDNGEAIPLNPNQSPTRASESIEARQVPSQEKSRSSTTGDDQDPTPIDSNGECTSPPSTPPDHLTQGPSEISDVHERMSATSTDEDSDFGVEIYRTCCLSEQHSRPSNPESAKLSTLGRATSWKDGKRGKLDRIHKLAPHNPNAVKKSDSLNISRQSNEIKQISSSDSSNKSTIRWQDGYIRHDTSDTSRGSFEKAELERRKTGRFHDRGPVPASTTSNVTSSGDDMQPLRRRSSSRSSRHYSIGARDNTRLAPCGDLRYAVEAIERMPGLHLANTSEAPPTPHTDCRREDASQSSDNSGNTLHRRIDELTEKKLEKSILQETNDEPKESDDHCAEASLDDSGENLPPTTTTKANHSEEGTNPDDHLTHKAGSSSETTESSQANTGSDHTAVAARSSISGAFGSHTVQEGMQKTVKERVLSDISNRNPTDEIEEPSHEACYRIISDGSIHSGPGLDRDAPSSGAQRVVPEAIGPRGLRPVGKRGQANLSNATSGWSSGSDDCGFAAWYTQNERHD